MSSNEDNILTVENLTKSFGGIVAIDNLSLTMRRGILGCLIGPNGAGKTTLFNLLTSEMKPSKGKIIFSGTQISGLPQHEIARMGIARSYQVPNLFNGLSVFENVRLTLQVARESFNPFRTMSGISDLDSATSGILQSVLLESKRNLTAAQLSHGEKKKLELAICLSHTPTLLLLDEPTAGMNTAESQEMAELIRRIATERRMTVLIVEHDLKFVKQIAERVWVMHKGKILAEGSTEELERDARVMNVYLGRSHT